jgi:hypothetical protein
MAGTLVGENEPSIARSELIDVFGIAARRSGRFVGERKQRITLRAAHASPRVLAQEENDERKDQAQADRQSKWNDRHGM